MTKRDLQWHEDCVRNSELNLKEAVQQLQRLTASVQNHRTELYFHRLQIIVAKERGLTEFDPDRFLKTRKR
jgi:hypothetical protein